MERSAAAIPFHRNNHVTLVLPKHGLCSNIVRIPVSRPILAHRDPAVRILLFSITIKLLNSLLIDLRKYGCGSPICKYGNEEEIQMKVRSIWLLILSLFALASAGGLASTVGANPAPSP